MKELIRLDLTRLQDYIASVLSDFPLVAGAYLYGSALGECRPDSDIDVGIIPASPDRRSARDRFDLETRVETALGQFDGHPFDVRTFFEDSPLFVVPAVRSGKLVFARDMDAVTDLLERAALRYRDAAPRHRQALREVLER